MWGLHCFNLTKLPHLATDLPSFTGCKEEERTAMTDMVQAYALQSNASSRPGTPCQTNRVLAESSNTQVVKDRLEAQLLV